jgi:hypothetical protein
MFLLATFEFDVGTPVRLYGAFQAASTQVDSELTFVLGTDMPWNPRLLPPDEVTQGVDAPLGMTGVRLEDFHATGQLRRGAGGATEATVELRAAARFTSPTLWPWEPKGALVLDNSGAEATISPRLALVQLCTAGDKGLTLAQLVQDVIGGEWEWDGEVAEALEIRSGSLYYLRPPAGADANYRFPYAPPGQAPLVCKPGYNASAVLRFLDKYDFEVDLGVGPQGKGTAVTLTGTLLQTLDFDFVQLVNPGIQICVAPGDSYLRVESGVTVLGTALQLSAGYMTDPSGFVGTVTTVVEETTVGVTVEWTDGGFHIVQVIGLPTPDLDLVDDLLAALNARGGCQKVVSDWLKELTHTSFGLKLDGAPKKEGGTMRLPLEVTYDLKAAGISIASDTIPFEAVFEIPDGLSALPGAVAGSVAASAASFAGAMLANPATYKAIALEAARRGGPGAVAAFICRLLEKPRDKGPPAMGPPGMGPPWSGPPDGWALLALALALVAEVGAGVAVAAGTLAEAAEFAETAVRAAKAVQVARTEAGGDGGKTLDPEAAIRTAETRVADAMQPLLERVDGVRGQLAVPSLTVEVDAAEELVATWAAPPVAEGLAVTFQLTLLQGSPGTATGAPWPGFDTVSLPAGTTSYAIPLSRVPDARRFEMNASVVATATGFDLLSGAGRASLQNAIATLNGMDGDAARQAAAQLQGQLDTLVRVDDSGVAGTPVYATYREPTTLTVGRSRVGLGMRLGRQP